MDFVQRAQIHRVHRATFGPDRSDPEESAYLQPPPYNFSERNLVKASGPLPDREAYFFQSERFGSSFFSGRLFLNGSIRHAVRAQHLRIPVLSNSGVGAARLEGNPPKREPLK